MSTSKPRQKENSDLRSFNNVGKRIAWCREQLGLTQRRVAEETNISLANYAGREYGVRSIYHEEYLVLSRFFNEKWTTKTYEGTEINQVKVIWLMFGIFSE